MNYEASAVTESVSVLILQIMTVKYLVSTVIRTYKYTILILITMFVEQKEQLCQTTLKSQKCNFPNYCPLSNYLNIGSRFRY